MRWLALFHIKCPNRKKEQLVLGFWRKVILWKEEIIQSQSKRMLRDTSKAIKIWQRKRISLGRRLSSWRQEWKKTIWVWAKLRKIKALLKNHLTITIANNFSEWSRQEKSNASFFCSQIHTWLLMLMSSKWHLCIGQLVKDTPILPKYCFKSLGQILEPKICMAALHCTWQLQRNKFLASFAYSLREANWIV